MHAFMFCCKNRLSNYVDVDRIRTSEFSNLNYGFEWVKADARVSVDLDLNNSDTAGFLELLYFTCVLHLQNFYNRPTSKMDKVYKLKKKQIALHTHLLCPTEKRYNSVIFIFMPNTN